LRGDTEADRDGKPRRNPALDQTGTAVYEFTFDDQSQTLERRFFTIWRRQPKRGVWKIYANTGVAKP
jgi:hypothetical protein